MTIPLPHLVFLCGLCVYIGIRAFFQICQARQQKSVSRACPKDWFLVLLVAIGQVALPLMLLFTSWLDFANYALPQAAIWLGTPLVGGGLWLFWRSHSDLGKSWSVSLKLNPDHKLVTNGVYRHVRHPMYASFFLLSLGQLVLLQNGIAGWGALVAVTLLYMIRRPNEERMMVEFFGDQYVAYREMTGGIIPHWRAASLDQSSSESH